MKFLSFIFFFSLIFSNFSSAQELKLAVLAPEGTTWANHMRSLAETIKKETNDQVTLRIYFGGAQGDEPDVIRKIRLGQLQGGVFTGKTLGEISGDLRVMEVPFLFGNDISKARSTLEQLEDQFNKNLQERGFINLGFIDVGMVYLVSQKNITGLEGLSGVKIWQWEGDPLANQMLRALNFVSVPLSLPDVLSSLSTGIIEAAYAPPLGLVSFQWTTRVNYLLDYPLAYSMAALLVDQRSWSRISAENQGKIRAATTKFVEKINGATQKDNNDALAVIRSTGVEFVTFSEADIQQAHQVRDQVVKELTGNLFSQNIFEKVNNILASLKNQNNVSATYEDSAKVSILTEN